MEKVEVSLGGGWAVRISLIDGAPFITVEKATLEADGGVISAGTCIPEVTSDGIEFRPWHNFEHDTHG